MYFIVKDEDPSFQEEKREFSNVLRHSRRLQLTLPETPSLLNHYPYSMLRRFDEALDESDVPFFWHIPKSAGSSLKHVMGTCMNKVMASRDAMLLCGESKSDEIELCQSHLGTFVPLDTSESEGLGKAKKLGLVPSKLADVVISNDFRAGSSLFMANHGGRAFTIFRHPVHRVVSTFYYLAQASWEPKYNPEYAKMSILEYAQRDLTPTNWVTRSLVGSLETLEVTHKDLQLAKEIVKEKMLVLIFEDIDESINRLLEYFGWEASEEDRECVFEDVHRMYNHMHYPALSATDEAWELIAKRNEYDIHLYHYAKSIYSEQKKHFSSVQGSSS